MKYLLLIILLLIPMCLHAATEFAWDPVTTNEDNSVCNDLAGYKVKCGNAPGAYTMVKDCGLILPIAGVCTYPISNVVNGDGTFYCVATAYDTSGNESVNSNEINFTVAVKPKSPAHFGVR